MLTPRRPVEFEPNRDVDEAAKRHDGSNFGARFVEAMLCLAVEKLPEGPAWQYEGKLHGYRAIGVRTKSVIEAPSPAALRVSRALRGYVETVLYGENVMVDESGNFTSSARG